MPSGIGSWRRRETTARFVGGTPRRTKRAHSPVNKIRGRVLRVRKRFAVSQEQMAAEPSVPEFPANGLIGPAPKPRY